MFRDVLQPNVICYSAAITACEKGGEWRKALHLLLKMINSGVEPDTIAYNASISARYAWRKAVALLLNRDVAIVSCLPGCRNVPLRYTSII